MIVTLNPTASQYDLNVGHNMIDGKQGMLQP